MANGIFQSLIKTGTWTPKVFDYINSQFTFVANLPDGKYWKIGKITIASINVLVPSDIPIAALLIIGNIPMNMGIGATVPCLVDYPSAGYNTDMMVQLSNRPDIVDNNHACAYFRPNSAGTLKADRVLQVTFIGYDR